MYVIKKVENVFAVKVTAVNDVTNVFQDTIITQTVYRAIVPRAAVHLKHVMFPENVPVLETLLENNVHLVAQDFIHTLIVFVSYRYKSVTSFY